MLEYLVIFSEGGAVLWTFGQLLNVKGNPIETLVRQCLLEDKGGENGYIYRPPSGTHYTLKWTFDNVRFPIQHLSRCAVQFSSILTNTRMHARCVHARSDTNVCRPSIWFLWPCISTCSPSPTWMRF
jgi:Signal recognition particle, alpha subunit, N-terminal